MHEIWWHVTTPVKILRTHGMQKIYRSYQDSIQADQTQNHFFLMESSVATCLLGHYIQATLSRTLLSFYYTIVFPIRKTPDHKH